MGQFGSKNDAWVYFWILPKGYSFNFAQSRRARGASKLYQWFFQKKSHSGQLSHFRPKNDAPSKILDNERSQELHENYINGFSENIFLWGKCTILGPKIMCRV